MSACECVCAFVSIIICILLLLYYAYTFDLDLCVRITTAFGHVTAIPDGFTQIDVTNCDPQYIIIIIIIIITAILRYICIIYDLIWTVYTLCIRYNSCSAWYLFKHDFSKKIANPIVMRMKLRVGSRERFIRFIFCKRIIKSKPHVRSNDAIGIILYDNNNNLMVNILQHRY